MAIKIRKKGPRGPGDDESKRITSDASGDEHVVDAEVVDAGGVPAAEGPRPVNPLEQEELAEPDRFVEASVGLSGWLQTHWKGVAVVGAVVLTGVIGWMIWDYVQESAAIEQSEALTQAIVANTTPTRDDVAALKSQQQQIALMYQLRGQQLPPDFDLERLVPTQFAQVFPSAKERNEAVLQSAQALVEQYPDSELVGEARLLAAAAALRLDQGELALELVDAAAGHVGENTEVFVLQARAAALADAGQLDEAIALYREILEAAPRYYGPFALLQIGTLLEQAGQTDKAADAYAELIARFPESEQEIEQANRRLGLLVADPKARVEKFSAAASE